MRLEMQGAGRIEILSSSEAEIEFQSVLRGGPGMFDGRRKDRRRLFCDVAQSADRSCWWGWMAM